MTKKPKLYALLLFTPQIIMLCILIIGIIAGIIQSFGIIPALNLNNFTFDYYLKAFNHPNFVNSFIFTFKIAFISATLSLILGLFLIYLFLLVPMKSQRVIDIMQIPIIIPHIIVALFMIIFFSKTGMMARLFNVWLTTDQQYHFSQILYHPNGLGIILAYLWKGIPFIIFYSFAMIKSINETYGEASRTMGASHFQSFILVTLPLCKETVLSGLLFLFMYAFGAYELPKLLGPTLPKHLAELAFLEFSHPDMTNRPYAMAINGIILLFSILTLFIYYHLTKKGGGK